MKWIKIILLCCIVFIISCRKIDITPTPQPEVADIFSVKEVSVKDGQTINFNLKAEGTYTLTLTDSVAQQVVTRELINGKNGSNSLKLWTKSLPTKYLYLSIEDGNNTQIGKTLLVVN